METVNQNTMDTTGAILNQTNMKDALTSTYQRMEEGGTGPGQLVTSDTKFPFCCNLLRYQPSNEKIYRVGLFYWYALKMSKYEEKLKYLDWSDNCSSRKVLSVKPQ